MIWTIGPGDPDHSVCVYLFLSVEDLQCERGRGAGPDLQGQEQQEQQHDRLAEKGQSSPWKNVGKLCNNLKIFEELQ